MELFLDILRRANPKVGTVGTVENMRVAAKGLVNLVANRRDLRL